MRHTITRTQLAAALKVSRPTLAAWMKMPGWPPAGEKGWTISACEEFVAKNGLNYKSDLSEEKKLLTRAQRLLAELKLRREEGELVSRADIMETHGAAMAQFTAILKRTLSRQDYDACARQFQKINWDRHEQKH